MKYIGPFFRMNSLSPKDISGQLFYLSKESMKTIVLNSKCGIQYSVKSSKKSSSSDNSILSNSSPIVCIYKKSSPVFVHSKTSHGFDESSFKKETEPFTNALMTLNILELSNYYSNYKKDNRNVTSLQVPYSLLAKEQLQFYYKNLRNPEGIFVNKKNISDNNIKGFNLIEKDKKFNFVDQAFMMNAYYLFSLYYPDDPMSEEYKNFSFQILEMFFNFKEAIYNISFDDGCKLLLSFNVFYDYSKEESCKELIVDLSDFLINKFDEKDYYASAFDSSCLLAISLNDSYKHTNILSFKEKSNEIFDKLINLYDEEKGIFIKLTDKKEVKYSSLEICFYFLAMMIYSRSSDNQVEIKNIISTIYKKYFINSGLITSWPDAPTLDEVERYRGLSLHSQDMLDESFFRMPNLPTPESTGIAPVFTKGLKYSIKKDTFSKPKETFDSNKNMLIFFTLLYYLKDDISSEMNFTTDSPIEASRNIPGDDLNDVEDLESLDYIDETQNVEEAIKEENLDDIDDDMNHDN